MELTPHAVKLFDVSPCAHQVLGLDLAGAHLALLSALANLGDKCLFLLLELNALLVQFSDSLVEESLVFAKTLGRRHTLAESPFQDLVVETWC